MESAARLPKAVSAHKRERDLFRLYSSCFRDIPQVDDAVQCQQHVPRPAQDSSLTAFAQLAAIRLGGTRSLISLMCDKRQYVLAEATPGMSVRRASPFNTPGDLWLGSVSIPRAWAVCEEVLNIDPPRRSSSEDAVVVFDDLSQNEVLVNRTYGKAGKELRSYVGVALTSPDGAIVGSLCIFDSNPGIGISQDDVFYLQDLAATIAEYLDTYTLKDQYKRGERLTRGLISFAEGASTLQPFKDESTNTSNPQASESVPFPADTPTTESTSLLADQFNQETGSISSNTIRAESPTPRAAQHTSTTSVQTTQSRRNSVKALQDSILPTNSKSMFSRAASVLKASNDLDGVVIFDASVVATTERHHGEENIPESEEDTASESSRSKSSSDDDGVHRLSDSSSSYSTNRSIPRKSRKKCQILGFATAEKASVAGDTSGHDFDFLEPDLALLLRKFPRGKILHYAPDGEPTSSADDSDTSGTGSASVVEDSQGSQQKSKGRLRRSSSAIHNLVPSARSVCFVPFWDFERSRWFAGCICWTNKPDRFLTAQLDLAYFKIFSNSIMTELARLDAINLHMAKTTFVASISHELRSPLHGVLGSIQFLQDTALDAFQVSMLNSMAACGQTLLDTLNHVLDHAKINETPRNVSTKRFKDGNTIRLSSKPLKPHKNPRINRSRRQASHDSAFDISMVTEEVVEAVFTGQSYRAITSNQDDGSFSPSSSQRTGRSSSTEDSATRKNYFVVLDMAYEQDWMFSLPAGSWRRILMNIFGNALKYTQQGSIYVSLRAAAREIYSGPTHVILTIKDSGSGMSPQFLANKAFQPFSQENPHATGTGLGLSIVRQIVETIGGKVEVTSDMSSGTKFTVKLALPKPEHRPVDFPQRVEFLDILPRLEGRRICILHQQHPEIPEMAESFQDDQGLRSFADALARTLKGWLKMEVVQTTEWTGHDNEIVICPQISFDYLKTVRKERQKGQKAPVIIFVAMDALEAATLRSDARIMSKESVVEVITQPCGPYKLAHLIDHCLKRYGSADENLWHTSSGSESPITNVEEPATQPSPSLNPTAIEPAGSPSMFLSSSPPSELVVDSSENAHSSTTEEHIPKPPFAQSTDVDNAAHMPIRDRLRSRKSYVLIVDDNAVNRKLLVTFLKKQNIMYHEAENGLQALQKYQEGSVRFDAILMDISMPVLDGMSATRAIREYEKKHNVKRTYIVALTGLASASARLEAWSSGVDYFMTKPIKFKELEQLLMDENKRRESPSRAELKGSVGSK